jgi:hypothetical protein
MNPQFPVVLALVGAIAAGACSKSSDNHPVASDTPSGASQAPPAATANEHNEALVRIVNAAPGTPSVDVTAGQVAVATDLPYAGVTPYKPVNASNDDFAVKLAGASGGAVLAENSESITRGKHYTLIAFPGKESDKMAIQVVTDDIVTPEAGKARVRVVHAAADVDSVNVFAKGGKDAIFDGVDFQETTSYAEVDPTITTLELKSADGKRVVARPAVSIEAGKSYTIVVAGRAKGAPALQALIIEDRVVGQTATN